MQLELIGCTGAGKTTLVRRIQEATRQYGVVPGDDFVLGQFWLNWVRRPLLRKLLLNLLGLLAALATWRKNRAFYHFAARHLSQLPIPPFEKIQLLRNVLKRIGIYEIIRLRHDEEQIVLVDEGPLQTAHNLFVHAGAGSNQAEEPPGATINLAKFTALVPLSDGIIYLRQPEELLTQRTVARGHARIRRPTAPDGNVRHFVRQAIAVFEALVQEPLVAERVLIVDGSSADTAILLRFGNLTNDVRNAQASLL